MKPTTQHESSGSTIDTERWVKLWEDRGVFEADGLTEPGSDQRPVKYVVSMFPYPSGDLHMGHAEVYSIGDAIARYARLNGWNVLHPIGWDSFGLPAENAALRRDLDPASWTYANIDVQAEGFRKLGISFDWRTRLHTSDPEYYRWTQWLFTEMFRRGLAYRKAAPVNWCPVDSTVLANEQVIQGRCERCGSIVERRNLSQWFLRITDFAQRLLDDMEQLTQWPDDVLRMQQNWIGRSIGATINFTVEGHAEPLRVFTSRPDTLFGATFVVVAADAELADELCNDERHADFLAYRATTQAATDIERLATDRPKTGVFLGRYVINPVNGERLPLYASDYVLADYGSGAIMAVPAHDQRDLDFAMAMGLPVRMVVDTGEPDPATTTIATTSDGVLVASGNYSGLPNKEAGTAIVADLAARGLGEATVNYRLRDWLVSRQRYWGTPIPIIHCDRCGEVPVPDEDLPVRLPESGYTLRPADGRSPLASATDWVKVDCPTCGSEARRDTDTLDTFVDSSWYFLRFPNPEFDNGPFDPAGVQRWMPTAVYIGGKEHAILHLLYARFLTKVLHDAGMVGFVEPFTRLVNQGQVIMHGKSMSKSLGNLVNLQEQIAANGSDAVRVTMLFAGPPEDDIDWADVSPSGSARWLGRVLRLAEDVAERPSDAAEADTALRKEVHKLIAAVTAQMEDRRLNVAIARLMELTSVLRKAIDSGAGPAMPAVREGVEALARMLSCFAPFTAEEAWERLGRPASVSEHGWPRADPALLVEELVTCVVQVDGKVRDRLEVPPDIDPAELQRRVLSAERISDLVRDRTIRTVIVRAPRLVNVVLAP